MSGRRSKKNQKLGSSRRGTRGLRVDNNEFDGQDEVHTTNQSDDTVIHAKFDHLPSLSTDQTSALECSPHAESAIHKDLDVEAELPERKQKIGSTRKKAGGSKSGRKLEPCDEVRTTEEFGEEQETQLNTSFIEEHTYSTEHEQRNAPSHLSQQTQRSKDTDAIHSQEISSYSRTTSLASYEVGSNMAIEQSTAQSNVVTAAETDQETLLASTLQKRKMGSTRRPLRGNREVQGILRNKTEDVWKAEVKSSSEAEFSMLEEMMQTWDDVKRKESPTNTSSYTESAFVPDEQVEVGGFSDTYQDVPDSRHDTNTSEDCRSVRLDKTKEEPFRRDPKIIISSSKQDIEIDKLVVNVEEPLSSLCPLDSATKDDNFEISTDVLTAQVNRISETFESDITHAEHTATDSEMTDPVPDSYGLEDGEKETLMESSTSGQEMKMEEEHTQSKRLDHEAENVNIQATDIFVEQEIQSEVQREKTRMGLDEQHSANETNVSESLLFSANCNLANLSPVTGRLHNANVNLNSLLLEDSKSSCDVMAETAVCSSSNDSTINNEQSDVNVPEAENVAENQEIYVDMNEENNIDVIETSATCDVTVTEIVMDVENFTEQSVNLQTLATRENESVGTKTGPETDAFEITDQENIEDNVADDIMTQEFKDERENKEEVGDTTESSNQKEQPTSQIQGSPSQDDPDKESYDFIQGTFEENAEEILLKAKSESSDFDGENETCENYKMFEDFEELGGHEKMDASPVPILDVTEPLEKCQDKDVKLDLQMENLSSDVNLETLHASENAENISGVIDSALILQDAVTESSLELISIIPEDSYGEQKKDRYSEGVAEEDKGPEFQEQNNVIDHNIKQTLVDANDNEKHEMTKAMRSSTEELCDDKAEGHAEITSEQQTRSSSNISQTQDGPPQDDSENMLESVRVVEEQDEKTQYTAANDEATESEEIFTPEDINSEVTVTSQTQNQLFIQTTDEHIHDFTQTVKDGYEESGGNERFLSANTEHAAFHKMNETNDKSKEIEDFRETEVAKHLININIHDNDSQSDLQTENPEQYKVLTEEQNNTTPHINLEELQETEHAVNVSAVTDSGLSFEDVATVDSGESHTEPENISETPEDSQKEEKQSTLNPFVHKRKMGSTRRPLRGNKGQRKDREQDDESERLNNEEKSTEESINDITESQTITNFHAESQENARDVESVPVGGDRDAHLEIQTENKMFDSTVIEERTEENIRDDNVLMRQVEFIKDTLTVESNMTIESDLYQNNTSLDSNQEALNSSENLESISAVMDSGLLLKDVVLAGSWETEAVSEKTEISITSDNSQEDSPSKLNPLAHKRKMGSTRRPLRGNKEKIQSAEEKEDETNDKSKEIEDFKETEAAEHLIKVNIQDNDSQLDLQTENPEQYKVLTEEQNNTNPHINLEELQETEHAVNVSAVTDSGLSFEDVATVDSGESHTEPENISETPEDSQKEEKQSTLNPFVHKRKMGSTRRPLRGNKGQRKDREQDDESEIQNSEDMIDGEKEQKRDLSEEKNAGPVEEYITESQTTTTLYVESQENARDVESVPVGGDTDAHSKVQTEIKMFDSTVIEEITEENIRDDNVLMRQVELVEDTLTVERNMTIESDLYQNNTSLDSSQEVVKTHENVENISTVTDSGLVLQDAPIESSLELYTVPEKTEDSHSKLNPVVHKRKMGSTRRPLRGIKEKEDLRKAKEEDMEPHSEIQEQNDVMDGSMVQKIIDVRYNEEETSETVRISVQDVCDPSEIENKEEHREITFEQEQRSSSNISQTQSGPSQDDAYEILPEIQERTLEFKDNPLVLSDVLLMEENQLHVSSEPAVMVGSPGTEEIQSVFSGSVQKRKMGSTRKTRRGQRMEKEREFGEEHDGETKHTSTNEDIIKPEENFNLEEVMSLPITSLDPNKECHDIENNESILEDHTENAEQTEMLVKEQNDSNSNTSQAQSEITISIKSENKQSNMNPTTQKRKMGSTRKTLRGNGQRRREVELKEMDEDSERTSEEHPTEFATSERESESMFDVNTQFKESRSTESASTIFSESVVSEENLTKSQFNEVPSKAFSKTDLQSEMLVSACDLKVDENDYPDHSDNSGPSKPEKLDISRNLEEVGSEHKVHLTMLDQSQHVMNMERPETITPERRRKMGSTRKNFRGKQEEKKREESDSKQFAPRKDQDSETSVVRQAERDQIIHDSFGQSEISLLSEIERALNKTSQSSPNNQLNINEPNFANTPIETSHYNTPENSEPEQGSDKEKYVSLQVTESQNPEISSPGRRRKMGSTRKNPRQQLQEKREEENKDSEDEMAEKNKHQKPKCLKNIEATEESKVHDIRDQEGKKEYLDVPVTLANSCQIEESQEKTSPSTKRKFGSRRTNIGKRDLGGQVPPESNDDVTEDAGARLVSLDEVIKATPHDRSPGKKQTADLKNISDKEVVQFNVVMVGNSCVGKTSFVRRFYRGQFSPDYSSTIGVDTCVQNVVLHDRVVKLHIWDTAGQERFHSITTQVFHRADGLLLMYEITSSKSLISVRDWISQVQEKAPNDVIMMLLGNKSDCAGREVQVQEGEDLAREYKIDFMECSAATGDNVSECMKSLAELLVQRKRRRKEEHTALKREQPQKKSGCC